MEQFNVDGAKTGYNFMRRHKAQPERDMVPRRAMK